MKTTNLLSTLLIFFGVRQVIAQGTFIYDQQSADESAHPKALALIQQNQPTGQSFTPSLSSVGFVSLWLWDDQQGNGLGATLDVNLRADSITGPILGTSASVFLPDGTGGTAGFTDFLFAEPVSVTPGTTYYFQPVVQSGDSWLIEDDSYNYSGGTWFAVGSPNPDNLDLWFREGIVVPEPSTWALLLLGGGALALRRRNCREFTP